MLLVYRADDGMRHSGGLVRHTAGPISISLHATLRARAMWVSVHLPGWGVCVAHGERAALLTPREPVPWPADTRACLWPGSCAASPQTTDLAAELYRSSLAIASACRGLHCPRCFWCMRLCAYSPSCCGTRVTHLPQLLLLLCLFWSASWPQPGICDLPGQICRV